MARLYCPLRLATGLTVDLPAGPARHVQVLRLQPGDVLTLFNNGPGWSGPVSGGEFSATVTRMGRSDVQVHIDEHHGIDRPILRQVHLAVAMPANDRMDWLIEKATELGARSIQPLMSERSVLRLSGDRVQKKVAHWQAIAIASSEQCGGNEVPTVHPVLSLQQWLAGKPCNNPPTTIALVLSLREGSTPLNTLGMDARSLTFLSGPEGGLSASEEDAAMAAGFLPASLGPRVLRSETAAIAALAGLSLLP